MSLVSTTGVGPRTTTWSYQLQFNFKFKKSPSSLWILRAQSLTSIDLYRRCRRRFGLVQCVAQEEQQANGSGSGSSDWDRRRRSVNDVVDWIANSDDRSGQKNGAGGILGIGLASALLVAGITSAALAIGKRNSSRPKAEMQPLTEQQELSVTSDQEVYTEEETRNDMNTAEDESNLLSDHHFQNNAGTETVVPSTLESLLQNDEVELLNEREKSSIDASGMDSATPEFPQLERVDASSVTSSFVGSQNTITDGDLGENLDGFGLNASDADGKFLSTDDQRKIPAASQTDTIPTTFESFSISALDTDPQALDSSVAVDTSTILNSELIPNGDIAVNFSVSTEEDAGLLMPNQFSGDSNGASIDHSSVVENGAFYAGMPQPSASDQVGGNVTNDKTAFESPSLENVFASRGIPAPSLLSASLQVSPGKVLVPAVTDQTQAQTLAALQVLKVIESNAEAGDLCTRREYARWLVSASSVLSRKLISKVYPAMYIENVTELAFDDITPEDPDFISIQGLAEAGLISSKLSRRDMLSSPDGDIGSFHFHPDSPLSRQDLVTWKMALEKRQLPVADKKVLYQLSGFIDIDKIDPDAFPALVADVSAGEQGIVALAFGYTRLFQPDKPVTKGQAAIALATCEAADIVSEELARIEAESIADKAVTAHIALVAEVEKDINANFEKELLMEREKIDAVQKMAEEARQEVERLRAEREVENSALMKQRIAVESEMEVLSRLRHELEEQLQSLMGNKVELSYEKERVESLRKETEEEHQAITRLQYELEVERKALSMARAWAEDEAKRVQEHARALEEARERWERRGIKVVVDEDLQEEAVAEVTWSNVGKKLSAENTVKRADNLTDKLKIMAGEVKGRSKEIINKVIEKIEVLISAIKEWFSKAGRQTTEFRDVAVAKTTESMNGLQQQATGFSTTVKEGTKRAVDDCREGMGKLTQRFKT